MDPRHAENTCPQTSSFLTFTHSVYKVYMIPFLSDVFPKLYIQPSNQSPPNPRCPSWSDVPLPKARLGARTVRGCWVSATPSAKNPQKKGSHSLALGFMGRDSQPWSYWMKASQAPCSTSARRNRTFWKDLLKGLGQSVLFMNLMAKSHFLRNSFIVIQYLDTFVSSRVFHPRHIWRRPGDELKELLGFVKETMGRWDGEKHYVKMMVERFLAMITTTRLFFWENESSSNW